MKDLETIDMTKLNDVTGGISLSSIWDSVKQGASEALKHLPKPPFTVPLGPLPYPPPVRANEA